MIVKLMGVQTAKGTSKKTGSPYDGFFIHYAYPRQNVVGYAVKDTFCDRQMLTPALTSVDNDMGKLVGMQLNFDFDDRGYLMAATPVPAK